MTHLSNYTNMLQSFTNLNASITDIWSLNNVHVQINRFDMVVMMMMQTASESSLPEEGRKFAAAVSRASGICGQRFCWLTGAQTAFN